MGLDWNKLGLEQRKKKKREEEGGEGRGRRGYNSTSALVIFRAPRYDELEFTVLYVSPFQFHFILFYFILFY